MPLLTRAADRLQAALERAVVGPSPLSAAPPATADSPPVRELVATAQAVRSVRLSPRCAPDPGFVSALALRLREESALLAAQRAAGAATRPPVKVTSPGVPRRRRVGPVVVVLGHGVPRVLAGVLASVLAVGGVVGVASRSAVPGTLLYPVKQVLDDAAVRFAGSDFDKGVTLLSQGRAHITDAQALLDAGSRDPGNVNVALEGAIGTVAEGQRLLGLAYARTADQRALLAVRDFSDGAIPQLEAMRDRVPAGSVALLERLRSLVESGQRGVLQTLAECGGCGQAGQQAREWLRPTALTRAGTPAATGAATTDPSLPGTAGAAPAPSDATLVPAPGLGVGGGAGGLSSQSGTVGGGGVSATLPIVSLSASLPVVIAPSVPLPSPAPVAPPLGAPVTSSACLSLPLQGCP